MVSTLFSQTVTDHKIQDKVEIAKFHFTFEKKMLSISGLELAEMI
jgi:hypothetical protein